jgi:hypothetical protein
MSKRTKSTISWKKVRSVLVVMGLAGMVNFGISFAENGASSKAGVGVLSGNAPRPKAGVGVLTGNAPRPKAGVGVLSGNAPRPKAGVGVLSGNAPRP